jgi:hypothetical protein
METPATAGRGCRALGWYGALRVGQARKCGLIDALFHGDRHRYTVLHSADLFRIAGALTNTAKRDIEPVSVFSGTGFFI